MRRPRHRVKSNLLWKMLGIAALVNALLWPILIRLGVFHGVGQGLIPVTLVAQPPSPKAPVASSKAPPAVPVPPKPAPLKPAPVVAAKPPVPAPKPVLVASAPPAARRPAVSVVEKPPVASNVVIHDNHVRRKPRAARRPAYDDRTANETPPRRVHEHPAPKIAAVPAPAKPAPPKPAPTNTAPTKPAERVASRPPTPVASPVLTPPTPTAVPDATPVPPSETSPSLLQPAVAVVKTQPEIPKSLQNHAWHALFRGQFDVDKDGAVTPHMVSSTGNADLDARSLEAARHWKFRPATKNGVPVASTVKFEIEYSVRAVP